MAAGFRVRWAGIPDSCKSAVPSNFNAAASLQALKSFRRCLDDLVQLKLYGTGFESIVAGFQTNAVCSPHCIPLIDIVREGAPANKAYSGGPQKLLMLLKAH